MTFIGSGPRKKIKVLTLIHEDGLRVVLGQGGPVGSHNGADALLLFAVPHVYPDHPVGRVKGFYQGRHVFFPTAVFQTVIFPTTTFPTIPINLQFSRLIFPTFGKRFRLV